MLNRFGAVTAVRKHRFTLPNFFTLADGRIVYIEREFDDTNALDAADAEYEAHMALYQAGDYSYPSAFRHPDYEKAYGARDAYDKDVQKIVRLYDSQMNALGWYGEDHTKRATLTRERDDIISEMAKNAPSAVQYERAKAPTHRFTSRIFRIDLDDRMVEFRQGNGKRGKALIADIAPISDGGKVRLLNSNVVSLKEITTGPVLDACARHWTSTATEFGVVGYRRNPVLDWDGWAKHHASLPDHVIGRDAKFSYTEYVMPKWLEDAPAGQVYTNLWEVSQYDYGRNTDMKDKIPRSYFDLPGSVIDISKQNVTAAQLKALWPAVAAHNKGWRETAKALNDSFPKALAAGLVRTKGGQDAREFYTSVYSIDEFYVPIWLAARVGPVVKEWEKRVARAASFFEGGEVHRETGGKIHHAMNAILFDPAAAKVEKEDESEDNGPKKEGNAHILYRFAMAVAPRMVELQANENAEKAAFQAATPASMPKIPHLRKTIKLMPHQAAINSKMATVDLGIVEAEMGAGKCVEQSTLIFTDKGLLTAGEMVSTVTIRPDEFGPLTVRDVQAWNMRGKLEPIGGGFNGGVSDVLQVRTATNYHIVGRPEHPVLVLNDQCQRVWCRLDQLTPGMGVVMQKGMEVWGTNIKLPVSARVAGLQDVYTVQQPTKLNKNIALLLGLMVAEGHLNAVSNAHFTNTDLDLVNLMVELAKSEFGGQTAIMPHNDKPGARAKKQAWRVRLLGEAFRQLLLAYGMGALSEAQCVPRCIRTAPRAMVIEFLRGLFEGDGGVSRAAKRIEFTTTSRKLADEIRMLLLNLGITSSMDRRDRRHRSPNEKIHWRVHIHRESTAIFAKHIGFMSSIKNTALARAIVETKGMGASYGAFSKIPEATNMVLALAQEPDSARVINAAMGYHRLRLIRNGENIPTTQLLGGIQGAIESTHVVQPVITELLDDSIFIDCVATIKTVKRRQVVDLSMPDTHSFNSNGFISHNTAMFFNDAMVALETGRCVRPMFVMPTNTVRQQVDEVKHKFGDNINIIGITSDSFRSYGKGDEAYKKLASQIRSAPPNTLIFVGYEWLQGQPRKVDTGRTRKLPKDKKTGQPPVDSNGVPLPPKPVTITDYWRGRYLIDECGVDYVTLDECHKVKNPDTARATSVYGLSSAKVKRIGSGTLFPNTPDDVVGPMQFLDPTMFGDKTAFGKKFGLTLVRGKVVNFPPKTMRKLRETLLDFRMISARRTSWMHLMPKRVEEFHSVKLSKVMQGLYQDLLDGVESQIAQDPKLRDAWAKFSEDTGADDVDLDAEAPMLLTMLGRLDQFITAPDSEIGGDLESLLKDAQGSDAEDQEAAKEVLNRLSVVLIKIRGVVANLPEDEVISPKCRKAAELIDAHFSGADPGKAMVFVSNVGSAQHFAKYLGKLCTKVTADEIGFYKADARGRTMIDTFKDKDSKIKVLCAVDWSLMEGHNLQVASMLIRGSLHWSPGATEQTYGRIFRPGATRPVKIHVLVTENTLEIPKLGRLLSKYDAMRRVNSDYGTDDTSVELRDNSDDEEVKADEELAPIRMNQDTLAAFTKMSQLGDYIARYDAQNAFDMREAERMAKVLGKEMYDKSGDPLPGAGKIPGLLPYYDIADAYMPVRIKILRGRGEKVIIDDHDSLEVMTKADASRLKLVYKDDGASGFFWRPIPADLDGWLDKLQKLGYEPTVSYSDAIPPVITPEAIDRSNKPAPAELSKPPAPEWEVAAQSAAANGSTRFVVYRQPTVKADGTSAFRHLLVQHAGGVRPGDPTQGDTIATFLLSSKDAAGQLAGISEKAWGLVNKKVAESFQGELDGWSTEPAMVKVPEPVAPAPAVPGDTTVGPDESVEPPPAGAALPANVISSLRLLSYDGIWYAVVDSTDDNAPAMRTFGLVWFNAFYQREFASMADARKVITILQNKGLTVDNIDEFNDHARDAIWARKVPQRKLLREQLVTMKARRRDLTRGGVSIHYVQTGGKHHIAVSALSNSADIGKVKSVPGFNHINAAYWKPVPDRDVLKEFVANLTAGGFQVSHWDAFHATAGKFFHFKVPEGLDAGGGTVQPPVEGTPVVTPAPEAPKPAKPAPARTETVSEAKVNILKAVNAQNAQSLGAVLRYGGSDAFNIAVVQSLIDKGFMTADRNAAKKQYENGWLTQKGASAIGVPLLAPTPSGVRQRVRKTKMKRLTPRGEPQRVKDVAEMLDVPVADIIQMVHDGLVAKYKVPGRIKKWTLGVISTDVSRALRKKRKWSLDEQTANATGPGWTLRSTNMADEFEPEARWASQDGLKQIRLFLAGDAWTVKYMAKTDAGITNTSEAAVDPVGAIEMAKNHMAPR